jgi:CubicO group peptidase (beta-lactamase class C family)
VPDPIELAVFDLIPRPEPHPDLVAAQKVTVTDLLRHAGGLFPASPLFSPAVPARKD